MNKKEIKKLEDKAVEKISGGVKTDKRSVKEILDKVKVNFKEVNMATLTYGGPLIRPVLPQIKSGGKLYGKKKTEEGEKPEDALAPAPAPSEPKTEEKK